MSTQAELLTMAQTIVSLENSLNMMYVIICGAMIFLMQVGFGFLEAGCVRYKNLQSIIVKVFLNTCVAVLVWWIVFIINNIQIKIGYGIAFGNRYTPFVGQSNFGDDGFVGTFNFSNWVFQSALAAAANSIVSGGAAERMTFFGYIGLSVVFSGIVYPFAAHWGFGSGWLMGLGYHDFAGSGTIHATGGIGALITTIMLKPRKDRFNNRLSEHFEPNNPTYICLGTLTLWTCWIFFNAGSTLGVTGGLNVVMGRAAMNTMISGSSGALTVFIMNYFMNINSLNRYSLIMLCNGNLAGLVGITGACDNVESWAAFVIGVISGFVYIFANKLLFKLKIDDPVDAVPIHLACGILGVNVVSWFDMNHGILYGHGGTQFGVQLLGSLVFVVWSGVIHFLVLGMIKGCNILRVFQKVEAEGIDFALGSGGSFKYKQVSQQGATGSGKESIKASQEIKDADV